MVDWEQYKNVKLENYLNKNTLGVVGRLKQAAKDSKKINRKKHANCKVSFCRCKRPNNHQEGKQIDWLGISQHPIAMELFENQWFKSSNNFNTKSGETHENSSAVEVEIDKRHIDKFLNIAFVSRLNMVKNPFWAIFRLFILY